MFQGFFQTFIDAGPYAVAIVIYLQIYFFFTTLKSTTKLRTKKK